MIDKTKLTPAQLAWRTYTARGKEWRAAFRNARAGGATRYHAALIAEAQWGPDSFRREVCATAIADGRTGPANEADPPPRGIHAISAKKAAMK